MDPFREKIECSYARTLQTVHRLVIFCFYSATFIGYHDSRLHFKILVLLNIHSSFALNDSPIISLLLPSFLWHFNEIVEYYRVEYSVLS